ncbi:MAG: alkaline phosphatase PhoX [Acidobacteriota bacterium]
MHFDNETADTPLFDRLLATSVDRRRLLQGSLAGLALSSLPLKLSAAPRRHGNLPFEPLRGQFEGTGLDLAEGFVADLLATEGDQLTRTAKVGANHDFTAFLPIDRQRKGRDRSGVHRGFSPKDCSSREGLLVVNHEFPDTRFHGTLRTDYDNPPSPQRLRQEQESVGLSVLKVKRSGKEWSRRPHRLDRRIDALTPMRLSGPAAEIDGGPNATGTLGNCSGGTTPWGTVLSCEENYQVFAHRSGRSYLKWPEDTYARRHHGWVVEIDPFDPESTPIKRTALGRFRHENVAVGVGKDGTVVAYMGDDRAGGHVYKFVCEDKLDPEARHGGRIDLLDRGRLYAADFEAGRWLLLERDAQPALRAALDGNGEPRYPNQAAVVADAYRAAGLVGATPTHRPEDIEIHPHDDSVYIAFTNNRRAGDSFGKIVRLVERDDDFAAMEFTWDVFAEGGPESGFSSPDNLVFDEAGRLWMVTDSRTGRGEYEFLVRNSMFCFETEGEHAGIAHLFALAPPGSELTGPSWTPDGETLFLSVQHPGSGSSREKPSTHWPRGGDHLPASAVLAIRGA